MPQGALLFGAHGHAEQMHAGMLQVMGGQEQEEAAPSPSEDDSSEEEEEEAQPRQRRGSHSAQAQQRQQQQQGGAQDPQQRGKATRRQQAALGTAGKQAEAQRGAAREASQAAGKRKQQQQQQHPHHSGGGEGQQEGGRASKWARPSPTSPALEQQQGARGAASQGGAVTSRAARQPRQQHAPAEAAQLEQPAGSRQEPTAPQQQRGQQQGRSPTPAAAAAPLEVSPLAPDQAGPSSRAIEAAATQQQQPQQQQQQEREDGAWLAAYADLIAEHGPAIAARRWLSAALADARGLEARSVQLRPHLQAVHDSILSTLCNTVEAGHNNSLLLVGERGGGKTLVRPPPHFPAQAQGKQHRCLCQVACNTVASARLHATLPARRPTCLPLLLRQPPLCSAWGWRRWCLHQGQSAEPPPGPPRCPRCRGV